MTDKLEIEGRSFVRTAPIAALSTDGGRYALATLTDNCTRTQGTIVKYDLSPGALDLSLVRAGRCPLLRDHCWTLDNLLGQVISADVVGHAVQCVVRFARTPAADEIWRLIEQRFPLSLSVASTICHYGDGEDFDGERVYVASRWRLREISVVLYGRNEEANIRWFDGAEDAEAVIARHREKAGGEARRRTYAALHLDSWESWGAEAAERIASQLGADLAQLRASMQAEVRGHVNRLLQDLAV